MKNLALELPQGLFTDQQTQILNDRLREIQANLGVAVELREDLDAGGKRIKNLGDSRDGADALNQRTADGRYSQGGSNGGGGGGGSSSTNTVVNTSGDSTLLLSVGGALSIMADATPLASLAKARSATEIVALLQIAPDDGPVTVDIYTGAKRWAVVTIPAKATEVRMPAGGLGPIAPNQPIRMHIVAVGPAPNRPGSGLSVQIRFS
jgi:hypothetical protein